MDQQPTIYAFLTVWLFLLNFDAEKHEQQWKELFWPVSECTSNFGKYLDPGSKLDNYLLTCQLLEFVTTQGICSKNSTFKLNSTPRLDLSRETVRRVPKIWNQLNMARRGYGSSLSSRLEPRPDLPKFGALGSSCLFVKIKKKLGLFDFFTRLMI